MGERVGSTTFSREARARYREKVKRCLEALRTMLADGRFETGRKIIGVELEINLVDWSGAPMMVNAAVLDRIESADFQTELAQFNIEFNLAPHPLVGRVFREVEEDLLSSLDHALVKASELDARVVVIGILPTLRDLHVTLENCSNNPRYALLNEQILAARGEDLRIEIEGAERLDVQATSIMMEAASTSVQFHLEVDPDEFATYWNAAQAVAAAQVAVGANSPFFLGKELWRETRIALLEQSIDTRSEELAAQGVRPRVWFGERWIDSVLDLFEENARYFPALLPLMDDEDPFDALAAGDVPQLRELTLLNGTVYRWNRPVYGIARGKPHLRVENRVLPAGPTVHDSVANGAFYYGVVRALAEQAPPITSRMSFTAATDNFFAASREGIDAQLYWPGVGTVPASELVLRTLIPLAHDGLRAFGVDDADRERYLATIEQRCVTGRTGATWLVDTFHAVAESMDRGAALQETTRRYIEHMQSNEPVHTWPVPT